MSIPTLEKILLTIYVKKVVIVMCPSLMYGLWQRSALLLRGAAHFTVAGVRFLRLDDRWQHHTSPPPQFYMSLTGEGTFL